jgi:hypothetical protein
MLGFHILLLISFQSQHPFAHGFFRIFTLRSRNQYSESMITIKEEHAASLHERLRMLRFAFQGAEQARKATIHFPDPDACHRAITIPVSDGWNNAGDSNPSAYSFSFLNAISARRGIGIIEAISP